MDQADGGTLVRLAQDTVLRPGEALVRCYVTYGGQDAPSAADELLLSQPPAVTAEEGDDDDSDTGLLLPHQVHRVPGPRTFLVQVCNTRRTSTRVKAGTIIATGEVGKWPEGDFRPHQNLNHYPTGPYNTWTPEEQRRFPISAVVQQIYSTANPVVVPRRAQQRRYLSRARAQYPDIFKRNPPDHHVDVAAASPRYLTRRDLDEIRTSIDAYVDTYTRAADWRLPR